MNIFTFVINITFQDLIQSKQKVLPIDIRRIEHEDFIDYEIEFVELSEEESVNDDKHEKAIQVIINSKNSDSETEDDS